MLAADGVRLDAVVRTDEPTTLALAELDETAAPATASTSAGRRRPGLTPEAALAALPPAVGMLHVGTLGLTLEPMASALEAVVERLGGQALVMVDPNCRPSVIADADAYRAPPAAACSARSDVVKVCEEDLAWLDPAAQPADAARMLLEDGPRVVLLTRGGEGAQVVTGAGDVPVPAPAVEVVDTIGAGDAFGGGFLAWWRAQGLGREQLGDQAAVVEAASFASLVAARTVRARRRLAAVPARGRPGGRRRHARTAAIAAALLAVVLGLAQATAADQTRGQDPDREAHDRPAPIPFGAKRREEMRAYARRHYGIDDFHLRNPKVIVEHYTATDTFQAAYATFANDVPDAELHELPGTCAHFIVDKDGTIYQLVALTTMCRHTVGLNWTAFGIEQVGLNAREILDRPAQYGAVVRLTAWLRCRYGIAVRNVIGHNESLSSPYHHENVAALRRQTHSDWTRAEMTPVRARVGRYRCAG